MIRYQDVTPYNLQRAVVTDFDANYYAICLNEYPTPIIREIILYLIEDNGKYKWCSEYVDSKGLFRGIFDNKDKAEQYLQKVKKSIQTMLSEVPIGDTFHTLYNPNIIYVKKGLSLYIDIPGYPNVYCYTSKKNNDTIHISADIPVCLCK